MFFRVLNLYQKERARYVYNYVAVFDTFEQNKMMTLSMNHKSLSVITDPIAAEI